ncbi:MAG: type II secretion system F family protein [Burkholderiaceae bacterium]
MGLFVYRAIDTNGTITRGRMPAVTTRELESRLVSSGMELLEARPVSSISLFKPRLSNRDLISFCLHMETTLQAGLIVTEALQDQVEGADRGNLRDTLSAILQSVKEGTALSTALSSFPTMFDETFVGMVRSGEESGRLSDAFKKLGENLRWQDDLNGQLKKLLLYPAFTITVLIAVTLFMLLYLVPQLADFIRTMSGGDLPLQTLILLRASEFVQEYWIALGAGPFLLVIAFIAIRQMGGAVARTQIDALKLKFPVIGSVMTKILLSRFCALLGMLYQSGLPVIDSIKIARDAVGNRALAAAIDTAVGEIEQGKGITDAFASTRLFPSLMTRMIRIGETTGEVDKGLRNVSEFYNRDVEETIAKVQAMIEPALTLILGVILAWLMMSVLGPIYDLLSRIGV